MTLGRYIDLLRDHRRLVGLSILLCMGAAVVLASTVTPTYEAKAQFFVSTGNLAAEGGGPYEAGLYEQQRARSYAEIISSPRQAELVSERFGLEGTVEDVEDRITAYVPPDSVVIYLAVRDSSPALAKAIADSIASRLSGLAASLEKPRGSGRSPITLTVTEPARLPVAPVSPQTPSYLALGALIGLALGIAGARLRHALDPRTTGNAVNAGGIGAPVLGEIAEFPDRRPAPMMVGDPLSAAADRYRELSENLGTLRSEDGLRCLLVSSPGPREGKTAVVANLGIALARAGKRVVLVDANLHAPGVGEIFGVPSRVGLIGVLEHGRPLDLALRSYPAGPITILPAGRPARSPSRLLDSEAFDRVLEALKDRFDTVIIDSPAVLALPDAAILARRASGVILVARSSSIRNGELIAARNSLRAAGAIRLGVVLNGGPEPREPTRRREISASARSRPALAGTDAPGAP
jgi:capsular exopolysaccharide synthesis family protein